MGPRLDGIETRLGAVESSHVEAAETLRDMASEMRRQSETGTQMLVVLREINDRGQRRDGPILDAVAREAAGRASFGARAWEAAGSRAGIAVLTALAVAVAQALGLPMPRVGLDPVGPAVAAAPPDPSSTPPDPRPTPPDPAPPATPAAAPAPMGE